MSIEVLLLVLTVVAVVVAAFLIPLLIQLRSTVQRADEFLRKTEHEMGPLLQQAREVTERLNTLTQEMEKGVEASAPLFELLGEAGHSMKKLSHFLHGDAFQYAGNALGMWLGIRAATKTIFKELKHRRGED